MERVHVDTDVKSFECDGCGGSFVGAPVVLVVHDNLRRFCEECAEAVEEAHEG